MAWTAQVSFIFYLTALTCCLVGNCEAAATVGFQAAPSVTVQEGNAIDITVALTGSPSADVTVTVTTTGQTAEPTDYTVDSPATLTFTSGGDTTQTIVFQSTADAIVEDDETVMMKITTSDGNVTISESTLTVTIIDDDTASIGFSPSSYDVNENVNQVTVSVVLTTSVALQRPVKFRISTADGTAKSSDYVAIDNQQVQFNTGAVNGMTQEIGISITDDSVTESTENFQVQITAISPDTETTGTATVSITDNDAASIGFSPSSYDVNENVNQVTVSVVLTTSAALQRPVQFRVFTADGTAKSGSDYVAVDNQPQFNTGAVDGATQEIAISITDDSVTESTENFQVQITAISADDTVTTGTATVTITDNDPSSIGFSSLNYNVNENDNQVTVSVMLTTSAALQRSVQFSVSTADLSATSGTDYVAVVDKLLQFDIGADSEASQTVVIDITDDSVTETNEAFQVTITAISADTVTPEPATVSIINDDSVTVSFEKSSYDVTEGQMVFVNVVAAGTAAYAFTVTISTEDGTAKSVTNYVASTQSVKFNPGESTKIAAGISTVDIGVIEIDKTFVVKLTATSSSEIVLGSQSAIATTVTINDKYPSKGPDVTDLTPASATSLSVTWSQLSEADVNGVIAAYNICYKKSSSGDDICTGAKIVDKDTLTSIITGLNEATSYEVAVKAGTSVGYGPVGSSKTATTQDGLPTGGPNATVTVINSTVLNVSWVKLALNVTNGQVKSYTVCYGTDVDKMKVCATKKTVQGENTMSVVLERLNEATKYFVAVLATTSAGNGPLGRQASETTLEDVPASGPTATVTVINSTALNVSWIKLSPDVANGQVKSYTVCYGIDVEKMNACATKKTVQGEDTTSTTLEGLNEATKYFVAVFATTSVGNGQPGSQTSGMTDEAAPRIGPDATLKSSTATSLTVTWNELSKDDANGVITKYDVCYQETGKSKTCDTVSDGNIREATLRSLNEATSYTIDVKASTAIGYGPFGQSLTTKTNEAVPASGPNATVMVDSSTSLSVSWVKLSPDLANGKVKSYTVCYGIDVDKMNACATNKTVQGEDTTSATLEGLNEATEYFVAVLATTVGNSPLGSEARGTTHEAVPSKGPDISSLTPASSTSLNVTWSQLSKDEANGVITEYTICYMETGTVGDICNPGDKIDNKGILTHIISGLKKATSYDVAVKASTNIGYGNIGNIMTAKTLEDVPDKGPDLLSLAVVNSTSFRVTWRKLSRKDANGNITEYAICYKENSKADDICTGTKTTTDVSSENITFILSGLEEATSYVVAVKAKTASSAYGPVGNNMSATTLEDVPSSGPSVISLGDTKPREILVKWGMVPKPDANGEITMFAICYKKAASSDHICSNSKNTSKGLDSFILTGLTPDTQYEIAVKASTAIGFGPPGSSRNVNTFDDSPGAPESLVIISKQLLSIVISWQAPSVKNGQIRQYSVCWEPGNSCLNTSKDETNGIITTLEPGTKYDINVKAYTRATEPGPAISKSATTQPSAILPDTKLRSGGAVEDDKTQVAFLLPPVLEHERNSISFYRVIVKKWSGADSTNLRSISQSDIKNFPESNSGSLPYVAFANGSYPAGAKTRILIGNGGQSGGGARRKRNTSPDYHNAPLAEDTSYAIFVRVYYDANRYSSSAVYQAKTGKASSGLATAVVILIVVLIIVALLVAVFGVLLLRRRKRPRRRNEHIPLPTVKVVRSPIPIDQFRAHCERLALNSGLGYQEEYESVGPQIQVSSEMAKRPENIDKNRYNNIHAYDDSRVVLSEIEDEEGSDYINANYIDGFNRKKQFIASQGPIKSTIEDFWRMIWETGVANMVMVANAVEKGKEKCAIYWPQEKVVKHGAFTIRMNGHEVELADYVIRYMTLTKDNSKEERSVTHFHYTVWPDHGVPVYTTSLQAFLTRIRKSVQGDSKPLLVHCSAGVGRTGTFIGIFSMLDRIEVNKDVDIYNFVCQMRGQRVFMVQVESQYVFLHKAVLESIECGDTEISATDLRVKLNGLNRPDPDNESQTLMDKQFQTLNKYTYKKTNTQEGKQTYNIDKNRNQELLPYEDTRVNLLRSPGVDGSDYINASYIDSYQKRGMYIATQFPLENTVNDFWRMVWEKKSNCIVMLVKLNEDTGNYDKYWTEKSNDAMLCGSFLITFESETKDDDFIVRLFKIKKTDGGETRTITHFNFLSWQENAVPNTTVGVRKMLGQIQEVQRRSGNNPIIVHCSDGGGRTGAFCALVTSLERVKQDQSFNLFQTIMLQRIQRPKMVSSVVQYKFCFRAILDFLDSFDDYANFVQIRARPQN